MAIRPVYRDGIKIGNKIDFRDADGRRVRETVYGSQAKAERVWIARLAAVDAGTYQNPRTGSKDTFAAFVAGTFLPEKPGSWHAKTAKPLARIIGEMPLRKIDAREVLRYKAARGAEGIAPATLRHELGLLRAILKRAYLARLVTADQTVDAGMVELPAKPRPRGGYLNAAQREALIGACRPWLARIIRWAILTGMDRGEVIALDWSAIDFGAGLVRAPRGKTSVARDLPLTPTLRAILADCGKPGVRSIAGPIFRNMHGDPLDKNAVASGLLGAYRRAGLQVKGPFKIFRHTFRSLGNLAGVPGAAMAALMGHRAASITDSYGTVPLSALREAMDRIDAAFTGRDGLVLDTRPPEAAANSSETRG